MKIFLKDTGYASHEICNQNRDPMEWRCSCIQTHFAVNYLSTVAMRKYQTATYIRDKKNSPTFEDKKHAPN